MVPPSRTAMPVPELFARRARMYPQRERLRAHPLFAAQASMPAQRGRSPRHEPARRTDALNGLANHVPSSDLSRYVRASKRRFRNAAWRLMIDLGPAQLLTTATATGRARCCPAATTIYGAARIETGLRYGGESSRSPLARGDGGRARGERMPRVAQLTQPTRTVHHHRASPPPVMRDRRLIAAPTPPLLRKRPARTACARRAPYSGCRDLRHPL